MKRMLFAANVGTRTGAGHLVRCSSLAVALREVGVSASLLAIGELAPSLQAWLAPFRAVREIAPADAATSLAAEAERAESQVVLVDGVGLVDAIGSLPKRLGRVVIDDGPARAIDADVVIDPNLFTASSWPSTERPRVLAGERYALLRPEFAQAHAHARELPDHARRVLITCGAGDAVGATELYLRSFRPSAYDVTVAVGALNPRRAAIEALAASVSARVVVGATSLLPLAQEADLALSTLGVTAAELACLGVPNLSLAISEIQLPHLARYAAAGIVEPLGWCGDASEALVGARLDELAASLPRRRAMHEAGRKTVDGRGAERLAAALSEQWFR